MIDDVWMMSSPRALGWPGDRRRAVGRSPRVLAAASRETRQVGGAYARDTHGDALLPAQFFAARRGDTHAVRHLMLAVLEDAIACFQRFGFDRSRHGQRLFREAETWIMGAGDEDVPLRFEEVCAALQLEPEYVRGRLRAWRARTIARIRTALL